MKHQKEFIIKVLASSAMKLTSEEFNDKAAKSLMEVEHQLNSKGPLRYHINDMPPKPRRDEKPNEE